MATQAATRRLTKEYHSITRNPPPYITAHPSDSNILEWHYVLTGPPQTPYENGQYWGTLIFPPEYPFAPPAIRMHTPSGRFQPSTRLCLSISDFHPKSFNPAWEVATILIGLLSFMTGEEMTTGSVRASVLERKALAARSRWWNSTGGGSWVPPANGAAGYGIGQQGLSSDISGSGLGGRGKGRERAHGMTGNGAIKAGDGGKKFRSEWPELDAENWRWMKEARIDVMTGAVLPKPEAGFKTDLASGWGGNELSSSSSPSCAPADTAAAILAEGRHRLPGSNGSTDAGEADTRSWLARNKYVIGAVLLFSYVIVARMMEAEGGLSVGAKSDL